MAVFLCIDKKNRLVYNCIRGADEKFHSWNSRRRCPGVHLGSSWWDGHVQLTSIVQASVRDDHRTCRRVPGRSRSGTQIPELSKDQERQLELFLVYPPRAVIATAFLFVKIPIF